MGTDRPSDAELKANEAVRRFAGTRKRDVGREVSRGGRKETAEFQGGEPTPSEVAQAESDPRGCGRN